MGTLSKSRDMVNGWRLHGASPIWYRSLIFSMQGFCENAVWVPVL